MKIIINSERVIINTLSNFWKWLKITLNYEKKKRFFKEKTE